VIVTVTKRGLTFIFLRTRMHVFVSSYNSFKGHFKIVSKEVIDICLKIEEEQIKVRRVRHFD
jgi:hypothetical protein